MPRLEAVSLSAVPPRSVVPSASFDSFSWVVITLVMVAAFLTSLGPVANNDIGFHLRIGQEILESGPPRLDFHSYTCPGAIYPDHEWLSQVGLYLWHAAFGARGLTLLQGLLVGTCLGLVAWAARGPVVLRVMLVLAVMLLGSEHLEIRPHLLGWVMIALLALLLDKDPSPRAPPWRNLSILALLLVWANTHGSVLLGVGLAGLAFLEEAWRGRSWRPLRWAAAVALVPLLNPYTWRAYALFFEIRGDAGFVGEWKPYPSDSWQFWLEVGFVGAALVGIARRRPISGFDLVRVGVLGVLSFQSSRSGVVMAIFLAPSLARWYGPDLVRVPVRVLRGAALIAVALVLARVGWRAHEGVAPRFGIDHERLPVAALTFIEEHGLQGPMFNDYNFGGYLEWKAWPQHPVFVDGRLEVYSAAVLDEYLQVSNARPGWKSRVEGREIAFFVIRPERAVAEVLLTDPDWDLVYFDYNAVIFVRRDLFPALQRLRVISPFGSRDPGQVALAIHEARYLVEQNPLFFGGFKILAFLYHKGGDPVDARDALRRYLELHPQGMDLAETRSMTEALQRKGFWP